MCTLIRKLNRMTVESVDCTAFTEVITNSLAINDMSEGCFYHHYWRTSSTPYSPRTSRVYDFVICFVKFRVRSKFFQECLLNFLQSRKWTSNQSKAFVVRIRCHEQFQCVTVRYQQYIAFIVHDDTGKIMKSRRNLNWRSKAQIFQVEENVL